MKIHIMCFGRWEETDSASGNGSLNGSPVGVAVAEYPLSGVLKGSHKESFCGRSQSPKSDKNGGRLRCPGASCPTGKPLPKSECTYPAFVPFSSLVNSRYNEV